MSLDSEEQNSAHHPPGAEYLCFKGNEELINNHPKEAIELYNQVLYELSPGHIGAFLNRCLAYNICGYPELAVYDAYAAVTLAYQCRALRAPTNKDLIANTLKYAAAEREAIIENHWKWVKDESTNVGTEWMLESMASLALIPDFAPAPDDPPPPRNLVSISIARPSLGAMGRDASPTQRSSLIILPTPQVIVMKQMFRVLELMGMWRLIGSLRQCGGGALADALAMVDEVKSKYPLAKIDKKRFDALGDLIMQEVEENYKADPVSTDAFMKTKITMVNRVIYPWNTHEPDMDKFSQLGSQIEIPPMKTDKAYAMRCKPATAAHAMCLRLVATRDIFPGELVITQNNPLQVTTRPPLKSESPTSHCNACTALMIEFKHTRRYPWLARFRIPGEEESDSVSSDSESIGFAPAAPRAIMSGDNMTANSPFTHTASENTVQGEQSLLDQVESVQIDDLGDRLYHITDPSFTPSASLVTGSLSEPFDTVFGNPDTSPLKCEEQSSPDHDTSSQQSKELPHFDVDVDFQRCRGCHRDASVCSTACADNANEYHSRLCCTGAEEMIRNTYTGRMQRREREGTNKLDTPVQRLLDQSKFNPHERFLYDLLFVRILGLAAFSDMFPLSHPDVRWLSGDLAPTPILRPSLSPASTSQATNAHKKLPWSFTNNVILPTRYMMEMALEPFIHPKGCEGWVINTLYAKIEHCTRVMKGLTHGKVYGKYKELQGEVKLGDDDVGREHWVGSLGHLVSMVGVEGEEGVEGDSGSGAANVKIEEGTLVKLFAIGEEYIPIDPMLVSPSSQLEAMDWTPSGPVAERLPLIRAGAMFVLGGDGAVEGGAERMQM